ncbi:MAG: hypothetical protein WCZ86_01490 [Desulfurivibrionaceae bacterium]|jgi:hypothetical protein
MAYERETDDHYCSVVLFSFCSSLLFILELIDDNTVNATFSRQGAQTPPQSGGQDTQRERIGMAAERGSTEHPASAFLVRVTARTIPDGPTKLSCCSYGKKRDGSNPGSPGATIFLGEARQELITITATICHMDVEFSLVRKNGIGVRRSKTEVPARIGRKQRSGDQDTTWKKGDSWEGIRASPVAGRHPSPGWSAL